MSYFKLLTLLYILMLGSCSTIAPRHKTMRLKDYVKKFYFYYKKPYNPLLLVRMDPMTSASYYNRLSEIVHISEKKWKVGSHNYRWMLVFHELGHAVLHRKHEDFKDIGDGCPSSIMDAHIKETCFEVHINEYMKELFSITNTMYPYNVRSRRSKI